MPAINGDIIEKNYTPILFDKDTHMEALNFAMKPNLAEHKDYILISA